MTKVHSTYILHSLYLSPFLSPFFFHSSNVLDEKGVHTCVTLFSSQSFTASYDMASQVSRTELHWLKSKQRIDRKRERGKNLRILRTISSSTALALITAIAKQVIFYNGCSIVRPALWRSLSFGEWNCRSMNQPKGKEEIALNPNKKNRIDFALRVTNWLTDWLTDWERVKD